MFWLYGLVRRLPLLHLWRATLSLQTTVAMSTAVNEFVFQQAEHGKGRANKYRMIEDESQ